MCSKEILISPVFETTFFERFYLLSICQEFYMSGCDAKAKTEVEIMWTNQHGTGPKTDDRVETQVILQYMCQAYPEGEMATNDVNREFEYHTIRNGQTLNTQDFRNGNRENSYIRRDRGLHEPANYYQAYFRRERNKGEGTITVLNSCVEICSVNFWDSQNEEKFYGVFM